MKFWEAMKALEEGKTVTPCDYIYPTNKDSLAKDIEATALTYWDEEWEIYEEAVQKLTFAEVVKGLIGFAMAKLPRPFHFIYEMKGRPYYK